MEKRDFIEMLINKIKNIPIEEILKSRINIIKKGGNYKALCPFHNDKSLGSFVISNKKGIFKCFSCGAGGDAIKFVSMFENINYIESAFEIGLEFGLISYNEYETYFKRKRYKDEDVKKIEKFFTEKVINELKEEKADVDTLDKIYKIFTSCCELTEDDKNYLLNERCIKENRLGNYFTMPSRRIMNEFIKKLEENNINIDILKTVPGFYYDTKQKKYTFVKHNGIGIKIKNSEGKIVGIQIRRKEINKEQSRYVWFSSAFANYTDGMENGTSSGSPIDVVYPEKIKNPTVAITEGHFKAEKLAELGFIGISIQGITTWKGIIEEILQIVKTEEYKKIYNWYFKKNNNKPFVYICFDADMFYNYQVYLQAKNMTNKLQEKLEDYFSDIQYIYWNDDFGKGFDDLVNNNKDYINKIMKSRKNQFEKMYENIIEIIKENEKKELNEIDKNILKKYFLEYSNLGQVS